jgi:hypothetical protein
MPGTATGELARSLRTPGFSPTIPVSPATSTKAGWTVGHPAGRGGQPKHVEGCRQIEWSAAESGHRSAMDTTRDPLPASDELERFAADLAAAADHLDFDAVEIVFAADDPPDHLIVCELRSGHPAELAEVDQLFAGGKRKVAGALMRMAWSPSVEPTTPAWVLIAVRPGEAAIFAVRRVAEDSAWWRLHVSDMPWLVASTSSAIRAALECGQPMTLKMSSDARLFRRMGDGEPPPTDARGMM